MAGMRMTPRVKLPAGIFRRVALAYCLLIVASCVPATSAYRTVPGLRGQTVTVPVEPLAPGEVAPRLATTPLGPVEEFDVAALPALDAVTNPAILASSDPAPVAAGTAELPAAPAPTAPLPDFSRFNFDAGPAVSAYAFRGRTSVDSLRAQLCLTAAIYYEAASESDDGQRAVAQVVLNRVRHPAYPNTVCDVVYQGTERGDRLCQFSYACDGSMARLPSREGWARASRIARAALAGYVFPDVGAATHYHTLAVNPVWNRSLVATAVIGAHIFYRWGGKAGQPGAFYASYTGREPVPGPRPHPIRPLSPLAPLVPGTTPTTIAAVGVPAAPALPDGSLMAIQAKANESLLAQQAALARAATARPAPVKPVGQDSRYVAGALPESDIRPEFQGSGQWIKR